MTREEEFMVFWRSYPRRVARANARKAFDKAIKKTTMEALIQGITDYVAHKPQWCDYAHPASWLNGERWLDEYEPTQSNVSYFKAETVDQHRQRQILTMQYRNARDEGNHELAAKLRAQLN